jgi:hypothetical protein
VLAPTLLLALAASGCDEEPDCGIAAMLAGPYEGPLQLRASGRDSCGFADTSQVDPESSAFAFVARDDEPSQSVYVFPQTQVLAAGSHPGRVTFVIEGNTWQSAAGACTVDITEFTREQWSRTDFFRVQGTVACPDPLVPASADLSDLTVSDIEFEGHLHAEVLVFDFL